MMNEVEATMKSAFTCINDNQVLYQEEDNNAYLYLDPLTTSTLQFLYEDLRKKQRSMVTYMSNVQETSIKYNHIHAEAVQALTNIQIYLQGADLQIDPLTTHRSEDVGGSPQTSQPPETAELTKNTDPDNLMDVSGQTLTGATTENHPGTETTEEQVLELNVQQDYIIQLCEGNNIFHRRLCQARMFPTSPSRQGGERYHPTAICTEVLT